MQTVSSELFKSLFSTLNHGKDYEILLQKCCNVISENVFQASIHILMGEISVVNDMFTPTKFMNSYNADISEKRKLILEVFFLTETEKIAFDEENIGEILVSIIAGKISKVELNKVAHESTERKKKIDVLVAITEILEKNPTIASALRQICTIISKSFQHASYVCTSINYEGITYKSRGFKETIWVIKESFVTLDDKIGTINVFYTHPFSSTSSEPFLQEEKQALIFIKEIVCGYINNYKGRSVAVTKPYKATPGLRKSEDFRKSLVKGRNPLQLFFNKQVLDKYIYLDMMQYKIKNILFVATLYDAFVLESEDSFFEWFMGEIYQYGLFSVPRITGVTSMQEALDVLKTMHFDLVILMVGLDNKMPIILSKEIRRRYKNLPIYLLINQKNDIKYYESLVPQTKSIDKLFVWNGNSQIFFAMVKSTEDLVNVENDTKVGLVRIILLIEDNAQYYSRYLQYLYSIIFGQIQQLISEGERNEINKISKIRSRPKIIHARNYEDAMFIYEKYKDFILCVISDAEFDRNGKLDKNAGIQFIQHLKKQTIPLPIILQSADLANQEIANKLGVSFLYKNSDTLFTDLKSFLSTQLNFGNFIFRNKEGKPIAEARTLKEFQKILEVIPEESIYQQAVDNQFSLWFMSRGEIQLAKTINPINVKDFENMTEFRKSFLNAIRAYKENKRRGRILNYDEVNSIDEKNIVSMANGSLGGKGRGLAFINTLIYNMDFSKYSNEINIRTPITAIIGTNEFDLFMEENNLYDIIKDGNISYEETRKIFIEASLSETLCDQLIRFLDQIKKPIAVRSSSLSEDSINQPFAGVFDTYIVPNNNNRNIVLGQLTTAIKLVYASIYSTESRHYFDAIHRKVEDEKMAVVLQEVVGSQHESYYYPNISGTAQSYNFYPVAHMKPEEGFANAAVGLGYYVVGGQKSFRFSPQYPTIDVFSPKDMLRNTQTQFCAVDLNRDFIDYLALGEAAPLITLDINAAERHGTIKHCASVFNLENENIEAGLSSPGPRIINFANILKYDHIPLANLLNELLNIGKDALGSPIEIEWAVDLTPAENGLPTFYLLQIKPMTVTDLRYEKELSRPKESTALLYTENSLGNGKIEDIYDVIYVDPTKFDKMRTLDMVREIEYLNNLMIKENRKYILIGPGRWGTRDRFLGIPVTWPQISNAKIIVEISLPDFPLDSSLGSHFFHNVTSMNIGYYSIQNDSATDFINWNYINAQENKTETEFFKHIRSKNPFHIEMNGKQRRALISL